VRVDSPTLFLSYARADQKQASKLAEALEAGGFKVWWDTLIEGGAVFAKSIEEALKAYRSYNSAEREQTRKLLVDKWASATGAPQPRWAP